MPIELHLIQGELLWNQDNTEKFDVILRGTNTDTGEAVYYTQEIDAVDFDGFGAIDAAIEGSVELDA